MVDYYWFFDFGFRSATLKYVAHYTATGRPRKVGEVLSTSLLYASAVAGFILIAVGLSAHSIVRFVHVAPGFEHAFVVVIYLITLSWTMGVVMGLSTESLEAVQRFDLTSRAMMIATGVRVRRARDDAVPGLRADPVGGGHGGRADVGICFECYFLPAGVQACSDFVSFGKPGYAAAVE